MENLRTTAPIPVSSPNSVPARAVSKPGAASPPLPVRDVNAPPLAENVRDGGRPKPISELNAQQRPGEIEAPKAPEVSVSLTTRERVEDLLSAGQLIASFDLRFAEIYLAIAREAYQQGASLGQDPPVTTQISVYS